MSSLTLGPTLEIAQRYSIEWVLSSLPSSRKRLALTYSLKPFGSNPVSILFVRPLGRRQALPQCTFQLRALFHRFHLNGIDAVQASGRFGDENWEKQQPVEMQTLDSLIAQFGRPAFAKIDVEGFEDQVLSGLSTPIPAMSFEFTPEYIDSTYRSIDRLTSLGVARFQLSLGESLEYVAAEWCDADGMKQLLAKAPAESFGDVYARFDP